MGLPIRRYGREAILGRRILRTKVLCDGVCCGDRIRRRRLRRGTILRVLLRRPKLLKWDGLCGCEPFWRYTLFGVLGLDEVYILILLCPPRLEIREKIFDRVGFLTCDDGGADCVVS